MSRAKLSREDKRQLGQFLTPPAVAAAIVRELKISPDAHVLEPSFGTGAFVFAVIDAMRPVLGDLHTAEWAQSNFHGCEVDPAAFNTFMTEWRQRGLREPAENFQNIDFFRWLPRHCERAAAWDRRLYFGSRLESYDVVLGNPPFGGSIDPTIQDPLDRIFGLRDGLKIKKETYAFFIVKCVDLLKPGGCLCFICSDTILTIPTMRGLRHWLQNQCDVQVSEVPGQFNDTNQGMVLVTVTKHRRKASHVVVFDNPVSVADIERTRNLSWRVDREFARYFTGATLGDMMIASSGMTVGNNALFVRDIVDGAVEEPFEFSFGQQPITLERELQRARLGQISVAKQRAILEQETRGDTRPEVVWTERDQPIRIPLPHPDYRFYNKACGQIVYAEPSSAIFWRDEGQYVYTFKKSGNWYLHGVGGKPYFGREGITWGLIGSRLRTRWLPPGCILDSGAPCAFLRHGVTHDELFFIMGWTLTDLCTDILKRVVNHTRNIQSKDFERLPYPTWVSEEEKKDAIIYVQELIRFVAAETQVNFDHPRVKRLNQFYRYREISLSDVPVRNASDADVSPRLF